MNANFINWFVSKTKFHGSAWTVVDLFVSKANNLGESDLIVVLANQASERVAILVEDKVDAPIQPLQAERYRLRADQARRAGEWSDYEIILCAPRTYLDSRPEQAGAFDKMVSFEEIAEFIGQDTNARAKYRSDFLATAATRRKNKWKREQDDVADAFWNFVPSWLTTKPKNKYLWIKCKQGLCDLTFDSTVVHEFKARIADILPSEMTVERTGNAAVIRVTALPFAAAEGIETALPKVRRAFESCEKLARFYCSNRSLIDDAANYSTHLS